MMRRYKFTHNGEVWYVESVNPQAYSVFQSFCKRHGFKENEVEFDVVGKVAF